MVNINQLSYDFLSLLLYKWQVFSFPLLQKYSWKEILNFLQTSSLILNVIYFESSNEIRVPAMQMKVYLLCNKIQRFMIYFQTPGIGTYSGKDKPTP